jgi:hypothetical protein
MGFAGIPTRPFQPGCLIEKPILNTGTKTNKPTHSQIDNQHTPREKGGLDVLLRFAALPVRLYET